MSNILEDIMGSTTDKLKALDGVEKDLASSLHSAGQALSELSKDKPSVKQVETFTNSFLKALESVEGQLSRNISYLTQVSTGQPHEGSSYANQKQMQMAWHRLKHSQSRLNELERLKNQHLAEDASRMQPEEKAAASTAMRSAPQPPIKRERPDTPS